MQLSFKRGASKGAPPSSLHVASLASLANPPSQQMTRVSAATLPPWAIVHVPHDATAIPPETRGHFVVDDERLGLELIRMADHYSFDLLARGLPSHQVVRFPVSRLVVDVERFENDEDEPMAARGMGVIYQRSHDLQPLRRALTYEEREALLARWYRPHHEALTNVVDAILTLHGRAVVIDAHSYPSQPLPYETDARAARPQICIGADTFHTPPALTAALSAEIQRHGYSTAINTPFAGTIIPMKHYRRDPRVIGVMIEVRRDLYLDEITGTPTSALEGLSDTLRSCLVIAFAKLEGVEGGVSS